MDLVNKYATALLDYEGPGSTCQSAECAGTPVNRVTTVDCARNRLLCFRDLPAFNRKNRHIP